MINKILILLFLGILKNYTPPPVPSVPSDFFQSPTLPSSIKTEAKEELEPKMEVQPENPDDSNLENGELPKGFFDDPMLDAKVSFYVGHLNFCVKGHKLILAVFMFYIHFVLNLLRS